MSLEKNLLKYISFEANKLALRHHAYHNAIALENNRKKERLKNPKLLDVEKPKHWNSDKKFNPFYVHKNADSIAKSITRKIISGEYKPFEPVVAKIPKKSGGTRDVAMYQIPDAAVSTFFYHRLLKKNRHRFSSFSYAYRNDRNVHFAIQDIAVELSQSSRIFVAEFDFSKFFDSIDHEYLFSQFDKNGFYISKEEQTVIRAFLSNREKGIPQGTSISLFLANLACWKLDKQFEREGLQFARYADDTVIWSRDYTKISRAFDIITEFSNDAGVSINMDKSEGISLLCDKNMPSEFASRKSQVEFLGYAIAADNVSIKEASITKIKKQISYILYKHLLQPLSKSPLKALKIPSNDRDEALLSAMCEIRRYLYGNLNDDMISAYLSGRSHRIFFKGIMSFYPIINNEEQLRELDGWLVTSIYTAMKKRGHMLASHKFSCWHTMPFSLNKNQFVEYCNTTRIKKKRLLKVPSFMKIYHAMKKGLVEFGVSSITSPMADSYEY